MTLPRDSASGQIQLQAAAEELDKRTLAFEGAVSTMSQLTARVEALENELSALRDALEGKR